MHLVIVTCELATSDCSSGGLASFTANMARIFRQNGHRVSIILVTTKEEKVTFDDDISLYNIYVKKSIWDQINSSAEVIATIINKNKDEIRRFILNIYKSELVKKSVEEIHNNEKIDIIHVCHLNSLAMALDDKIPYIVRISSYMNIWDGAELPDGKVEYGQNPLSILDKLDVYTMQKAKFVVSPSNLMEEIGRRYVGINPTVIESPFILNRENWDNSIYDLHVKGKKYIIHYGRMSYTKGTHIVAQIAKQILGKYQNIWLVLAGSSHEMQRTKGKKIKAHELVIESAEEYADRVIYAGCLVREQLYPLIQHAEICLFPSRIENLSNACIEAMAMGKIVIGTDGASYEQLIEDRESGFLCKRDNPDSFMQAVDEALLMNEETKQMMISKATERIGNLAPDVIYEKYYEYYQKVIREWEH